jgi:hypothetical protein
MDPVRWLAIFALLGVIGVIYGGWALLTFITGREGLSPAQQRFFRDGHAHAGVLLALSLIYFRYLPETEFGSSGQWLAGLAMLAGVIAQSGGFFLHMVHAEKGRPSPGTKLTRAGALLIGAALLALAIGLALA